MYERLNDRIRPLPSDYELQPVTHESNRSEEASKRRINFLAPLLMLSSLIFGTAFALGHHLFYRSLNSSIVESSTQQEWYTRVGTGLAFLVKTVLGIAIGTAFVQQFWLSLKSQHISVKSLDNMSSILNNPLGFVDVKIWSVNLILLLLALAKW